MNSKKKSACIFPETIPGDAMLFPLVQVFAPVVYCRAVEEDEISEVLQTKLVRAFEKAGLCGIHVPSPLGEHRERFLALVRDLKNRGDDYAARLKTLSLSGIGRGGRTTSESKNSIIESLLKSKGVKDKVREEQEMLLWQARLLLKLGEIFDEEQLTLQRELDKISELEQGLFSELRREQGQPFSLTRTISSAGGRTDGLQRLRLKAWTRLYCLGEAPLQAPGCFISTDRDAVDLLVEQYEKRAGAGAPCFLDLPLPARAGQSFSPERLRAVQGHSLFNRLRTILAGPVDGGKKVEGLSADEAGEWTGLLETVYPEAEHGRCRLHLRQLPEISAGALFMETFGRDDDRRQLRMAEGKEGVVIGHLEFLE